MPYKSWCCLFMCPKNHTLKWTWVGLLTIRERSSSLCSKHDSIPTSMLLLLIPTCKKQMFFLIFVDGLFETDSILTSHLNASNFYAAFILKNFGTLFKTGMIRFQLQRFFYLQSDYFLTPTGYQSKYIQWSGW